MLVADADAARRELAVLRAVGATRGQLAWRLARGALRTALAGIVVAVPGGALCGWWVSRSTGSMWPGFPHHFAAPWRILAEGAAGSLVFVLLVAVPTAILLVDRARRRGASAGGPPAPRQKRRFPRRVLTNRHGVRHSVQGVVGVRAGF